MKIVAANWKLNKTPIEAQSFCQSFLSQFSQDQNVKVLIFPSAIALDAVSKSLQGSKIGYGFQNVSHENSGALTGENSAAAGLSLGAQYALVGHSERRALYSESSEIINKKLLNLQKLGITPVYCVGESLAERDAGQTNSVLEKQIKNELAGYSTTAPLIVAYEPVWAIGTGRVATLEQIKDAHAFIRSLTAAPILYGGSVKPENSKEILNVMNVNGLLVGGASLDENSFLKICRV